MKLKISILTKINIQLKPELSKRAKRKLGVILGVKAVFLTLF